jgi:phage terminase large subunit
MGDHYWPLVGDSRCPAVADMSVAASRIAEWREHPAQMVLELFGVEPDLWQKEFLEAFPRNQRMAMQACKGPGKSTVLAWIGWNYLLTRLHPKIAATSISAANLADGLWTEMAKWQQKSALLLDQFVWTKTRIFARQFPETWFMSARAFSQSADANAQANTLAGFHSDYVLFLIDESGSMPRAVMVTAEAALAGCIEAHVVQAGNPTSLEGALHHAATAARRLWFIVEITGDPEDAKRSPRIPVEYAKEQIEQYGRDNPWVIVNIFGRFPPSSLNALIGPDEVNAAMKRNYREMEIGNAPRVMGIDVARFGDDASVIFRRQGIQCWPILKYRNIDSTQGAGTTARQWDDWEADAAFIDNTGGFGSGWIDQLSQLGKSPIGVGFANEAHNKSRYYNKRAEMYFEACEWIKRGGALPHSPELLAALTQTTYTFKGDRFLLEDKDQVKIKIGYSPDEADAFVLTFAEPITTNKSRPARRIQPVYEPFKDLDRIIERSNAVGDYNPYRGE